MGNIVSVNSSSLLDDGVMSKSNSNVDFGKLKDTHIKTDANHSNILDSSLYVEPLSATQKSPTNILAAELEALQPKLTPGKGKVAPKPVSKEKEILNDQAAPKLVWKEKEILNDQNKPQHGSHSHIHHRENRALIQSNSKLNMSDDDVATSQELPTKDRPMNAAMAVLNKRKGGNFTSDGSLSSRHPRSPASSQNSPKSIHDFYNLDDTATAKGIKKSTVELTNEQIPRFPSTTIYPEDMNKSIPYDKKGNHEELKKRVDTVKKYRLKKFNSTSTLFVDSVIINADLTESIKCVASYLHLKIYHNANLPKSQWKTVDLLSEKIHPLSFKRHFSIFRVYFSIAGYCCGNNIYHAGNIKVNRKLYINRMLHHSKFTVLPINWARIALSGALIASKVWDDHAVWNIDFCQIFPEVPVVDLNELEALALAQINFNVSVRASEYAKLYYSLRDLPPIGTRPWALRPLRQNEAYKITFKQQKPEEYENAEINQEEEDEIVSRGFVIRMPERTQSAQAIDLKNRQAYV
ncbi:hypothetical protein HDV01_004829 [Terramyces sp. JEL0728]|nr:hypothetical protein HDV01_004829 [Terramyces sp. JEL0728]